MAEIKTKRTAQTVSDFLSKVEPEQKRLDSLELVTIMEKITGEKAAMWGPTIVGFGTYHYKYESGHEGDMCLTGFSPRKQNLVVYLMFGFEDQAELLNSLGKHKMSKACLYLNKLADVDTQVLAEVIKRSVAKTKATYPSH